MTDAVTETNKRTRWFVYGILLAVFTGVAVGGVCSATPLQSANDRSRWCTVWSLVERGTWAIDEIDSDPRWMTIDKVRHRRSEKDEYHLYSSKPALLPAVTAGIYYAVRNTTGLGLFHNTEPVSRMILIVLNVVPMVIALALFASLLDRHAGSFAAATFVLAAAAFATLITPFLTTLNNHTVAATSVFITLFFLARILIDGSTRRRDFALAGLFAAWTCCNELPAALFGVVVFLLVFRADRRRAFTAFVPAALIPLAAFFITTWSATGGWKPFYLYYGTEKYIFTGADGIPSYWSSPQGLDANAEPPWVYLTHCLIGHHGIFSLTPVFLLSAIGLMSLRSWRHPFRAFLTPTLILTVITVAFYISRTQNYNYGGSSAGLRWTFWLIPLWLVTMAPVLQNYWPRRVPRVLASLLLALSVASAATALSGPWKHPWLMSLMQGWGWVDYTTPPPKLEHPLQSWLRKLAPTDDGPVTAVWRSDEQPPSEIELTARPTETRDLRKLTIQFRQSLGSEREMVILVDGRKLAEGAAPNEFVLSAETDEMRAEAIRFLAGIPQARPFRARRERYVRWFGEDRATRCVHASAEVRQRTPIDRYHRCDVYVSDAVPFGTVRFVTTVREPRTDRVLSRQAWTQIRQDGPQSGVE